MDVDTRISAIMHIKAIRCTKCFVDIINVGLTENYNRFIAEDNNLKFDWSYHAYYKKIKSKKRG